MEANNEIAGNEQQKLRARLDMIVSEENAENWWRPELFEKNTLPILPSQLEIIEGVPNEEQNYNCFVYALGLQHHPEIIGNKGWEFTRKLGPIFDELIAKSLLNRVAMPAKGVMVVYRTKNGSISHVGLMKNKDTVISKWSWGPLLKHQIFDVPADYGDIVQFYNLTPQAIDYVLAKQVTE
jgi:hypothetical protein